MSVLEFIKVVILGIVEGITEWLPISSTGHMILVDEFIKMDMTTEFKDFFLVVIQLGAILAVVVLYWSKLWPFYIRQIVIARPFNDFIEEKFNNYVVVAMALIVYGVIFIIVENYNKRRKPICTSLEDLSFATAFKIGIFQVLSVIPGTSRSGSTIIGGILVGTSRTVAAEFTFFLAIPVMFGASLLKLVKFGFTFTPAEVLTLVTGIVVAFFVSIIAIKFLMGYIKKHDFKAFGWYRIVLGVLVLGYFVGKSFLG